MTPTFATGSIQDPTERVTALRPIYISLVREFVIDVPECPVDSAASSFSQETLASAADWMQQVDTQIQVHQLRQFLQTTALTSEPVLRHLILHHLGKEQKSGRDRDKTDFLIVQYFSLCAAQDVADGDLDIKTVAQVLEPVLGRQQAKAPDWLAPLDSILQTAARSRRLSELLHGGVLEQGRKLKTQNEDGQGKEKEKDYFDPAAMLAFARYSFLIRRIFFRLMHDDLNAIQDGLRELERRQVPSIDCRRAQFSAEEPVIRLRMICQSWKVMFHAEYSSGQPLRMLVDLRAAVDDALANNAPKKDAAPSETSKMPKAKNAAAGARSGGRKILL